LNFYFKENLMISPSYSLTATERVLPRMALDFTTATLDPRVTFTRSGNTATVVNSSGLIAPINANLPRFDFDPTTLVCNGLLIEEARTNLLLNSNLTGSVDGSPGTAPTFWAIGFGTGAFTTKTTSIYGTLDGAQAIKFDAIVTQRIMFEQSIVVTSGVQYAVSFYVEAVSGSPGTVSLAAAGTTTATMNTTVTNPTTGKKSFLFTANGTGTISLRIGVGTSAGVVNTCSLTVSRIQVEVGSFATSYIPTVASTVTRTADIAVMTGTNFTDWYSNDAGTFMCQAIPYVQSYTITRTMLAVDTVTPLYVNQNSTVVRSFDGTTVIAATGVIVANTAFKCAVSYDVSGRSVSKDASTPVTGAYDGIFGTTSFNIGSNGSAFFWNGHIQKISSYKQKLLNAEVQAITK
jgi:hypothetical protein